MGYSATRRRALARWRSEEHTSELQSHSDLVCRLLLEKKKKAKLYEIENKNLNKAIEKYHAVLEDHPAEPRALAALDLLYGRLQRWDPFFFFNDTATTEIYTLSLHDALPISWRRPAGGCHASRGSSFQSSAFTLDRKSTRLNSSHTVISYAVFCLKKKKK